MDNQLIIKIALIAVLLLAVCVLILPGRGARGQAIRRLMVLMGALLGILAVAFPHLTQMVADWFGIGRGTDLLLYLLIVFFLAYVVSSSAHARKTDRTMTVLARKFALLEGELRKTDIIRPEATEAHGNETMFNPTDTDTKS